MKKIILPIFITVMLIMCSRLFIKNPETTIKEYYKSYGYTLSESPVEITRLTLNDKMTDVYENYNKILKKSGLDITPYLGKTVRKYTYSLKEIPSKTPVFANILYYKGKIIAADIMTPAIDGFMISPNEHIPLNLLT
ncbi:MAG: DUF4830 domain-containing protein [Clostridia bacterium]|nr:DUF4830 domain-containing protein [Clostridia bacterium]